MIHDGVELPKLLTIEKAAEILESSEKGVRRLVDQGKLQSVHVNGITYVLTEVIAARWGQQTPSRHNQDRD